MIVDGFTNTVVAGGRFELDLDDVEQLITEAHAREPEALCLRLLFISQWFCNPLLLEGFQLLEVIRILSRFKAFLRDHLVTGLNNTAAISAL